MFPLGSLRRVVAGNTVSQLIGRAIGSVSMIVVSLLIARRFGSLGYGEFIKITTYVGFFYLFVDYGLNAIAIRRGANSWRALLGLRLFIGVILSIVSIAIIVSIASMSVVPFEGGQGYTDIAILGILMLTPAIVVQAIITTANAYFQKKLRYDYAALAQIVGSATMVATALILSFFTAVNGPLMGVISLLTGSVATMVVSLGIVYSQTRSVAPVVDLAEYRSLFFAATPLGLALIFNLVYFHADSVILTLTRSTQEVGIYGLAYKVFELPLVVPIFFMNATYPILLKTQHKKNVFMKSFALLLISSLCVAAALWFAAPLVAIIKPEFIQSVAPLRVLLLGLPIFFVSGLLMWFLIAEQRGNMLLMIHGVAMVGNVIANIVLVPTFGYMAAAWITVGCELFIMSVSAVVVWRRGV